MDYRKKREEILHLKNAYEKREDRKDTFNPNSEYVAKSVEQYLTSGGVITTLDKGPEYVCEDFFD